MDRTAFYAALHARSCTLFGTSLSQGQVNTLDAIIDESARLALPISLAAYCMVTAYHDLRRRRRKPWHVQDERVDARPQDALAELRSVGDLLSARPGPLGRVFSWGGAFMSHGVAASQWKPLETKESQLQHSAT